MKKSYLKILLSVVTAAVVTGCGGGSSLNESALDSTDVNNNTTKDVHTGYFVDAAVAGADYNTSSGIKGTTDEFGRFKFKKGDEVEFRIGKIVLGKAKPEIEEDGVGLVTPKELAEGNETVQTLILRVLQSLDDDNNVTNGIEIKPEVKEELEKELNTTITIHHLEEEDIVKVKPLSHHIDKNHDGMIDVDEDDAIRHFDDSLTKWHSGHRPGIDKEHQEKNKNAQHENELEEHQGKNKNAQHEDEFKEHQGKNKNAQHEDEFKEHQGKNKN
jgi:hypothetical protein